VVRGLRRVLRPKKSDDERRYVRKRHVPADGMLRIEMKLLPDEAERVWQALRETRLELDREMKPAGAAPEAEAAVMDATAVAPRRASLADAVVAMAEAVLARLDDAVADGDVTDEGEGRKGALEKSRRPLARRPVARRPVAERRQLLVHLRADELERGALRAELHDGTLLDGDTLMRLDHGR